MSEIVEFCNNYFILTDRVGNFIYDSANVVFTSSKITYTSTIPFQQYDWIRIVGSSYNDGMYQISAISGNELTITDTLRTETIDCIVALVKFPIEFLNLVSTIVKNYNQQGVKSETLGDYSITYVSGETKQQFSRYRNLYNSFKGVI